MTPRTWTADNGDGTFSNPLFFDEFSDPDLIRVGRDFYLTGTTMHAMPGLPVLHSRDLVNWKFLSYASERLDFGPAFRLEDGREIYGQGIWAPSFRFHRGTFYIFANVRGQPMQVFSATNPAGPWKRHAMRRAFHDPSVLFDDDGRIYVVWGYRELRIAQLDGDLTDAIPGTERVILKPDAGMGEGAHFHKINGKYILTSAWYLGTMKMPCARADKPEGPYEVRDISVGEDFGIAKGAMHQGGLVDTPTGEWWGFSMMDYNSLGRLTGLSPVTWRDGWPEFGLPGNLGRSPRTWLKPSTGTKSKPSAPFQRHDDFAARTLKPIWQWNHAPADDRWSLTERPGFLRLRALPAPDFWHARNTLTQRAIGPISTATVVLETGGLQPGDIAGLGLLNQPYAWIGVRRDPGGAFFVEQFDSGTTSTARAPLTGARVWLRVECDFFTERARFWFSVDGSRFELLGGPFTMVFQLKTFQGVRFSLFQFQTTPGAAGGGFADFTAFSVDEPRSRGILRPIPYGKTISLMAPGGGPAISVGGESRWTLVRRGPGRVALRTPRGFVSVSGDPGATLALRDGKPGESETFQWIETISGEIGLLSLATHRYVRRATDSETLRADSPGFSRSPNSPERFALQL